MTLRPLLLLIATVSFAQTLPRPGIGLIEFPRAQSSVRYGIASTTVSIDGVSTTIRTALRSDDAGANWTTLYTTTPGDYQYVQRLIVHPDHPLIVYAVLPRSRGGLLRSANGGAAWEPFNTGLPAAGEITDGVLLSGAGELARLRIGDTLYALDEAARTWTTLAALPQQTAIVQYDLANNQRAASFSRGGAFYLSTDGGRTWSFQTQIMSDSFKTSRQIVFDPKDAGVILVRAESEAPTGSCPAPGGGLWRSTDTGRTFQNVYDSNYCNISPVTFIDPSRPNVYLQPGFIGQPYCLSTNRGSTFTCPSEPIQNTTPPIIAMDPRNGDVYRSALAQVSRDGLATWQDLTTAFRPTLRNYPAVTATLQEGESLSLTVPLGAAEGAYAVDYQAAAAGGAWLERPTPAGKLNAGLALRITGAALAPGAYRATITLTSAQTVTPTASFDVVLTVTPRAVSSLRYSYARLAGGTANSGKALANDVPALEQPLSAVSGLTRDAAGNTYVLTNNVLRRIDPNGRIATIAGTGARGSTPDNTPAAQAVFNLPVGVAVGGDGTIYVADSGPTRLYGIRNGTVRLLADNTFLTVPGQYPTRLGSIRAISAAPSGTVYASDGLVLLRLRGVETPEPILNFANYTSQQNNASLFEMWAESDTSFLFSAPLSHRIFRLASGRLTVVAGTGTRGLAGDGGPATAASLNGPGSLAADPDGNILFSDDGNSRLRLIRPDGSIYSASSGSGPQYASSASTGAASDLTISSSVVVSRGAGTDFLVGDFSNLFRFTRLATGQPTLVSGAAVNAASSLAPLAPGSLISVYGTGLATATASAAALPIATRLAGAELLLDGRPLPIVFASPGQVNAQLPPDLTPGPAKLQARVDGSLSAQIDVTISAAAPGIFLYGANRAVAQNQDGSLNGPDSPERPGRAAVLYLTGIGATDTAVAAGSASPASPLARAVLPTTVTLGGASANIYFTGLTPGFVGLAQINFQVPNLAPGDYPLTVSIGGAPSNAPLFRVGAP